MKRALVGSVLLVGCGEPQDVALALWRCTSRVEPEAEDPEGRLHRVTVEGSGARCNDGSPPIVWIEPATDPEHADDWVLYLQGGGGCDDQASCEERWCGASDVGGPRHMSSSWSAERRSGDGLFADDPRDPTRAWNKVFLHYCSSDYWVGTAPAPVTLRNGAPDLSLWFQGHEVLLAQLDALDAGARSDDGLAEVPSLADAERVLAVGSSAGGWGLIHHLDLLAERYDGAWVRGVVEGTSGLDRTLLPPDVRYQADLRLDVTVAFVQPIWRPWYEPDCVGVTCSDTFLLYTEAITTPYVVRHDLRDGHFLEVQAALGLPEDLSTAMMSDTALRIAELRPDVSVLETNCGKHVVTGDGEDYFDLSVDGVSLNDAVGLLLEDTTVVAVDTSPATASVCP